MSKRSRQPYRNGRVHVMADMCATCIFRPGNLVDLQPGRVKGMVSDATRKGSAIICHDTIYESDSDGKAVCSGFFTSYPTTPLQLAERLGIIEWITPPSPSESPS